ncbi:MAG: tetratricopeptide repeat protein [Leptolyngbyaceae cyanobacterium SM2_3_12]|nr:tetratricopeptide repeat protein [Leptolyngbyaceae cyanobacterium SM2_3_12]
MDIYRQGHPPTWVQTKPLDPSLASSGPRQARELHPIGEFLNPEPEQSDICLSQSAMQAVRQKQYGGALSLLNQLVERHPDQAIYHSNRGLVYLWMGHLNEALEDCTRAIRLNPDLDQAYNNRATCYAAMGKPNQALVDYERAIDLNPFNTRARINLGVTLRDLGEFEAALTCFDDALLFYQLPEFIYAERGRTYHQRGDWNCAIADYRRALATLANQAETQASHQLNQRVQTWMAELIPGLDQSSVN